jgi:[histone H3]-lysine4 N-trimethyltransferase MLL3
VCVFCRQDSDNLTLRELVGPVMGPIEVSFKKKKSKVYCHEMCALWTPEIYLSEQNRFKGLKEAIKRTKVQRCSYCDEVGGGLGCFIENCKETYHYLCAKKAECLFI